MNAMTGYNWQRIPRKRTDYNIRDQPLQFRFAPLEGTNTTRKIRFRDKKDLFLGKIVLNQSYSRLTNCLKKDVSLNNWYTVDHDWTVSVTKDFVVLSREGIPHVRWDIATDKSQDSEISCENQWGPGKDLSKVKLTNMMSEFNKESWFYTQWNPAGKRLKNDLDDELSLILQLQSVLCFSKCQIEISESYGGLSYYIHKANHLHFQSGSQFKRRRPSP